MQCRAVVTVKKGHVRRLCRIRASVLIKGKDNVRQWLCGQHAGKWGMK
jgi:hypothetical protein